MASNMTDLQRTATFLDQKNPQDFFDVFDKGSMSMLLLHYLGYPCEVQTLSAFLGTSMAKTSELLNTLHRFQLINYTKEGFVVLQIHRDEFDYYMDFRRSNATKKTLGAAMECLLRGDAIAFLREGVAVLHSHVSKHEYVTAKRCYDVLSHAACTVRLDVTNKAQCFTFFTLCASLQKVVIIMPWRVEYSIPLYFKMRGIAFMLGDKRSLGILDLSILYQYTTLEVSKKHTHLEHITQRGINAIQALDDYDMRIQSAGLLCFAHFIRGNFAEAVYGTYALLQRESVDSIRTQNRLLISFASLSAIYAGDFDTAINMLKLAIKRQNSTEDLENQSFRGFLCFTYLMKKDFTTFLHYSNEILSRSNGIFCTNAELWAGRSLAIYYYWIGDMEKSYKVFPKRQYRIPAMDTIHTNFLALPGILDLLLIYHQAGLPDPIGYSLYDEVKSSLDSPSILVRGTAYRIHGVLRTEKAGWDDPDAMADFQKSAEILNKINAPIPTARTNICLARANLAIGERNRAQIFANSAWNVHVRLSEPHWPDELTPLIHEVEESSAIHDNIPATCRKKVLDKFFQHFFEAAQQQYAWENEEEISLSLLYALVASSKAVRGAVLKKKEKIKVTTHVNLKFDFPSPQENPKELAAIAQALQSRQSSVVEIDSQSGQFALILIAEMDVVDPCCIYLEPVKEIMDAFSHERQSIILLSKILSMEFSTRMRSIRYLCDRQHGKDKEKKQKQPPSVIYASPQIGTIMEQLAHVARTDAFVLILGNSGVGKELFARQVHAQSGREGEFIAVNLASTPSELFESEFYGHEKGSFTGANYCKRGLFELADNGTLFIDEVGDIPYNLQVKLLRVLQEKSFMRVGGTRLLSSNFRLVAATNRDLKLEVEKGNFREDLFYRLSVVPITIPPLRERREDILFLANYFLDYYAQKHHIQRQNLTDIQKSRLVNYVWPGNVRQLKNVMERLTLFPSLEGSLISLDIQGTPATIENVPAQPAIQEIPSDSFMNTIASSKNLPSMEEIQSLYFEHAYVSVNGVISGPNGLANVLGISRTSVYAWIDRLKLKEKYSKTLIKS